MSNKARLDRLERATAEPEKVFWVWREGGKLTLEQEAEITAAKARGEKVTIFSWLGDDAEAEGAACVC